jgi:phasin family protein
MVSKTDTTTTIKAATPAEPKAVPAAAVADKVAPAKPAPAATVVKAEKPAQLVTKIVSVEPAPVAKEVTKAVAIVKATEKTVEPTPIAQGVTKMTDTVKATAEKANDYFADIRDRATEAAEKGKKLAADAVEFNKANVEAMIEAGKIAAKGAQDMGKTNVEFAKKNFEEMQVAVKEITSVKSPTDFMKLQSEYARKSFDVAVAQASKNTEAMVKLVSDMFQPISNRIAVTTDLFKKAA